MLFPKPIQVTVIIANDAHVGANVEKLWLPPESLIDFIGGFYADQKLPIKHFDMALK